MKKDPLLPGIIATDFINNYSISEQTYNDLLDVLQTLLSKRLLSWQILALINDLFTVIKNNQNLKPVSLVFERYYKEYKKNCEA